MKKELIYGTMGIVLVLALVLFFSLQYGNQTSQNQQAQAVPNAAISTIPTGTQTATTSGTASTTSITTSVVAEHNTQTDCWFIVNGKVYNMTPFIASHPGGEQAIISFCGKDATQAYNTKKGVGHSARATQMLGNFLVGELTKTQ
ncbi:cytochrome b5 domain-containing protein [Candidatus Roizmanbacteria bacterium]|nr:cytochrome b5 domain-containing protein [Candidatus Roizmanbacteria bacterium]